MKEDEILRSALEAYGTERQTYKLFEEMAELQEAICKSYNNRASKFMTVLFSALALLGIVMCMCGHSDWAHTALMNIGYCLLWYIAPAHQQPQTAHRPQRFRARHVRSDGEPCKGTGQ